MRITQWGEFGILCSMFIGQRAREGEATVGAAEIAASQEIDVQYAQQILQRLRKGDIIESVRGPHGGYKLARDPKEITLRQILLASEGDTFEVICETKPVKQACCSPDSSCSLRSFWEGLRGHVDSYLEGKTLDQLLHAPMSDGAAVQISRSASPS